MNTAASYLLLIPAAFLVPGCQQESGFCRDDGHQLGPACLEELVDATAFENMSVPVDDYPYVDMVTKHLVPAVDEPELLPTLVQNVRRFQTHLEFLMAVFPEQYGDLTPGEYMRLILRRDSRKYFAGILLRFDHPAKGSFCGFTVYVDTLEEEVLEPEEVLRAYRLLSENISFLPLYYTFDPTDRLSAEQARSWVDPGFPIYFND